VRLVVARPIFKVAPPADAPPDTPPTLLTAPMPPTIPARSIATRSLLAHVAVDKFCDGLPLHRQEDRFARLGCRLDRGTMSRWLEEIGATLGATVVEAMRAEALRSAFCIATDATGVLVQPIRGGDQPRRGCTRGHFFVQIADADHVFFVYTPRETSAAVGAMFTGFAGYVLADAKSVYDVLFRPTGRPPPDGDAEPARHEVGCWSHARRKFWEAAVTTADPVAREGLLRVGRLSTSTVAGRRRAPPSARPRATCTCARTSTLSSRGSPTSTSACATSAASCAARLATPRTSAPR
jgi:hypothetical protein